MVRFIQDDNAAFCKEWTHNLPGKWMEFFKTVHKCGFNLDYAQTDAVASTVSLWALYGQDGNSQLWYQFGRLSHKFGGTKRGKGPMMDADLGDFERMKEVVALVARYGGVIDYVSLARQFYLLLMGDKNILDQWGRETAMGEAAGG